MKTDMDALKAKYAQQGVTIQWPWGGNMDMDVQVNIDSQHDNPQDRKAIAMDVYQTFINSRKKAGYEDDENKFVNLSMFDDSRFGNHDVACVTQYGFADESHAFDEITNH